MNDEQLIWENYINIYSEGYGKTNEYTKEEFIRKLMNVAKIDQETATNIFHYYEEISEKHNKTESNKMLEINPKNGKYIVHQYNDYLFHKSYIDNIMVSMRQNNWKRPKPVVNKYQYSSEELNATEEYKENDIIPHLMRIAGISESEAIAYWHKIMITDKVKRNPQTNTYTIKTSALEPNVIKFELDFIPWHEKHDSKIYYHAGRFPIKVEDIKFDMGALGFHLGSERLVKYISKGTYKKNSGISHSQMASGNRLKISKFKVKANCGKKYIVYSNEDMPWEDGLLLPVYLYYQGIINKSDAIEMLQHFEVYDTREDDNYDYDEDEDTSYYIALDKIERRGGAYSGSNYHPADDLPMMSEHGRLYKDTAALEYIRRYLVDEFNYAAIEYINSAEGMHVTTEDDEDEEVSICILDPCILEDA